MRFSSLPVRGAWIEISQRVHQAVRQPSLPVRGAWIEINSPAVTLTESTRRSPCGERGLKLLCGAVGGNRHKSLPVRGAWIEIFRACWAARTTPSLPVRGAWIEIFSPASRASPRPGRSPCGERGLKFLRNLQIRGILASLPVRGAWIEIRCRFSARYWRSRRSPCGERGLKYFLRVCAYRHVSVAPRAGSVD